METEKTKKRMRKNDIILAVLLLTLSLGALGIVAVMKKKPEAKGAQVLIYVDGRIKTQFPLAENGFHRIDTRDEGYNIIAIKEGGVRMTDANCPDKLCVHQGEIRTGYEMIVCLPHGLYVEIQTEKTDETDIIVR